MIQTPARALFVAILFAGLAACTARSNQPEPSSAAMDYQVQAQLVNQIVQNRLRSWNPRTITVSPYVLHNVGNRYLLSLSLGSDRIGGDLMTLDGIDMDLATTFQSVFSNPNIGAHDRGLHERVSLELSKLADADTGVGKLVVRFSPVIIDQDRTFAILAVSLQSDPLAAADRIYLFQHTSKGWKLRSTVDLVLS